MSHLIKEKRSLGPIGSGSTPAYGDPLDLKVRDDGRTIFGYAAKFNKRSQDLGGFYEVLSPGCFTQTLVDGLEKHLLWDHRTRYVLGSLLSNGTLMLKQDDIGLYFEALTPLHVTYASDARNLIKDKYIKGCSFSFRCYAGGAEWSELPDGTVLRTIKACQLFEASVLGTPAYLDTECDLRTAKAEFDSFQKRKQADPWRLAEDRVRLLQLSV